jgi:hypothetical protein
MFYTVIRQFYKGATETHSVEVKADKDAALQRYFNIIAADLADATITYNAAYIIDSNGLMIEGRVFDRREAEE